MISLLISSGQFIFKIALETIGAAKTLNIPVEFFGKIIAAWVVTI